MIASGLHIGWSNWRCVIWVNIDNQWAWINPHLIVVTWTLWFLAAIPGTIIASLLLNTLKKKFFYVSI